MVESDITEFNKFRMPQQCEGRVPKKENPFFNIAKQVIAEGGGKLKKECHGGARRAYLDALEATRAK